MHQSLAYDPKTKTFQGQCRDALAEPGSYTYQMHEDYEVAEMLTPHLQSFVVLTKDREIKLLWDGPEMPFQDYIILELLKKKQQQ